MPNSIQPIHALHRANSLRSEICALLTEVRAGRIDCAEVFRTTNLSIRAGELLGCLPRVGPHRICAVGRELGIDTARYIPSLPPGARSALAEWCTEWLSRPHGGCERTNRVPPQAHTALQIANQRRTAVMQLKLAITSGSVVPSDAVRTTQLPIKVHALLRTVRGVGPTKAQALSRAAGVDGFRHISKLSADEREALAKVVDLYHSARIISPPKQRLAA